MLLPLVCVVITATIVSWEVWTHSQLGRRLAHARLCLPALFLRTTHVTLAADQMGHAVSVNDHLQLVRHASGRSAYLLLPSPSRPRPPMPRMVKAVLLTFFTL